MQKCFWSLVLVLGFVLLANLALAEDKTQKPDSDQPKTERKSEQPSAEEASQDESKKEEAKKEDSRLSTMQKISVMRRVQRRRRAIEQAVVNEDWNAVLAGLDEIIDDKEIEKDDKIQAMLDKFIVLAEEQLDGAKACPLAKTLGELAKDNADLQNEVAWTLLDTEGLKNRDLDLALTLARRACKLTGGQYGEYLDTLARAHFEKGDLDQAVEVQTQAVEKLKNDPENTDDVREEVRAVLEEYKAKQAEKKVEKAK